MDARDFDSVAIITCAFFSDDSIVRVDEGVRRKGIQIAVMSILYRLTIRSLQTPGHSSLARRDTHHAW
jgi:hypothetical protein